MVSEVRGVKLRRPLERKKVDGWVRAAMRSIEDDDIRKWVGWEVVVVVFETWISITYDFRRCEERALPGV
jgi:hypothetical protein